VDPKTDGAARDWVAIYNECSRILYQEIDYRLEGQNADRFRTNFKDVEWIKVPEVLWEYSNSQVLTLEYVPGGWRQGRRHAPGGDWDQCRLPASAPGAACL
jgi:predicted unusual protein kinase regulating ubiquinone biosynthesis (AarF/ABC1/UbiB family)